MKLTSSDKRSLAMALDVAKGRLICPSREILLNPHQNA